MTAPSHVDAATLSRWLAEGRDVTLFDVRTPAEFETAHIPGSYNVPLDALDEHADALSRHLDAPLVLICRSGNRADQAQRTLAAAGMANLAVLAGGILAWQAAGGPLRRGRPRWDLERQVRLIAGSLVLAGLLASLAFEPAKWLAAAVGAGLTFAALTNTCAMGALLSKLPFNRAPSCDVAAVVARLTGQGAERSA